MPTIPLDSISSTLIMLGMLSVLIVAHELGHLWVARRCGVRVERFGIGLPFGPTLWSKKIGSIEYCVHAALFGGYVAFPDDNPDSAVPHDSPERFENRPLPQRFAIAIAGIAVNAILGWVIMVSVAMAWGLPAPNAPVSVQELASPDMPAAKAGFRPGDVILAVGETSLTTRRYDGASFVTETIRAHAGKPLVFSLLREGKTPARVQVTPNGQGLIGIRMASGGMQRYDNPLAAASESLVFLGDITVRNFTGLGKILSGQGRWDDVAGPIGIVKAGGEAIQYSGLHTGFLLMAIISAMLAVMNLLPIPALDGGHILFQLIEAIKGSPVNKKIQTIFTQAGFFLLMGLMLLLLGHDIYKIFLGKSTFRPAQAPSAQAQAKSPATALPASAPATGPSASSSGASKK